MLNNKTSLAAVTLVLFGIIKNSSAIAIVNFFVLLKEVNHKFV